MQAGVVALFKAADLTLWLRTNGLEIVLIAIGAVLLARFAHWSAHRFERRFQSRSQAGPGGTAEQAQHLATLTQAIEWAVITIIYFVALILVLVRFELPLTTLVAPATVVGVGLGFGAQRIVQDVLAGFFLISERQFGVGDVIRVSQPGQTTGTSGTVEEVTLRVTKMRSLAGEVIIIPNGQILQLTNLSKGWAQVVVDVPVPIDQDVNSALEVLRGVAAGLGEDPELKDNLLGDAEVTGVEAIQVGYLIVRIVVRTPPGRQWEVGRAVRERAAQALQGAGIVSPGMTPTATGTGG